MSNTNTNKLRPIYRFPNFKENWEVKTLGDIAVFFKGKGISKKDICINGKYECIRYGELYTHYSEIISTIMSKTNYKQQLVHSKTNDVIIPASGESKLDIATASCVLKEGVLLGSDLNIIRTTQQGPFLAYYMSGKGKTAIAKLAQGISVIHLYTSQLSRLKIPLPSIVEQQKIGNFLSTVNTKISNLKQQLKQWQQYKKNALQQVFNQQLRFKKANGQYYPKWKVKKLATVANITMGQSPPSSSYNYKNIGLPLIQGNADIVNKVSSPRKWTSKPNKTCEIGAILISVRAPVGTVAKSVHNACIGRGICAISSKNNVHKHYIHQVLIHAEPRWCAIEQGSTFTSISSNDIKTLKIPLPSFAEQQKIGNFLSRVDAKITNMQQRLTYTQILKKGLLQQLFV